MQNIFVEPKGKKHEKKNKKVKESKLEKKVKKAPANKEIKKSSAKEGMIEVTLKKKVTGEAPEEYHFYLSDGRKLKNLFDLIEALENMSDDVFRHHVNEYKNDFSNWIRDVFQENDLADEVSRVESRIDTEVKLLKHLVKELTAAKS